MEIDSEKRWDFLPINKKHQKDSFNCVVTNTNYFAVVDAMRNIG